MRLKPLFLALSMSVSMPILAADPILQRADALIRLEAPDKAYEILAPLEEQQSGNPEYDYLLGVALLEKGDPQNAIFAFERCLAVEPKNGPCRVQMARTHLALGETDNARAELNVVNAYNPPPEVKQIVNQYLGAVDTLEAQQKRRITAYAQAGVGYDSNINSAPNDANKTAAALPTLKIGGAIDPTKLATSDDSTYASLNAGSSIVYKATNDVNLLADINAQTRSFFADHNFDYQAADASLGASFNLDTFVLMTKLQGQKMWLDGKSYRDMTGGLAQVQSGVGAGQMALFVQKNKFSYSTQSARDGSRKNMGIAYSQAINAPLNPSFYVSLYRGDESIDIANFQSYDFNGARTGGGLTLTPSLSLNGQLSYEKRNYNTAPYFSPLIFSTTVYRADKESNVGINLNWKINKQLSLQPNYTYTQNQSNISFSDYTRHVVSVDLRFDM
jgi:tetratricopeptide (TPR) repeat protein